MTKLDDDVRWLTLDNMDRRESMAKKYRKNPVDIKAAQTVKRYRKKPVVIEAMQYDGSNSFEVIEFVGAGSGTTANKDGGNLIIQTLEGDMRVSVGDFVIRGVRGEHYPCKPDIFADTYDYAPDAD